MINVVQFLAAGGWVSEASGFDNTRSSREVRGTFSHLCPLFSMLYMGTCLKWKGLTSSIIQHFAYWDVSKSLFKPWQFGNFIICSCFKFFFESLKMSYKMHLRTWLSCSQFFFVFWVDQEYGDSVQVDGFDIDYGVRLTLIFRVIWQVFNLFWYKLSECGRMRC